MSIRIRFFLLLLFQSRLKKIFLCQSGSKFSFANTVPPNYSIYNIGLYNTSTVLCSQESNEVLLMPPPVIIHPSRNPAFFFLPRPHICTCISLPACWIHICSQLVFSVHMRCCTGHNQTQWDWSIVMFPLVWKGMGLNS